MEKALSSEIVLGGVILTLKALESLEVDTVDTSTRVVHQGVTAKLLEGLGLLPVDESSRDIWKQTCNLVRCIDDVSQATLMDDTPAINAAHAEYQEAKLIVLMAVARMRNKAGLNGDVPGDQL